MLENIWFLFGAGVASVMGSVAFILAAKKKIIAMAFFSSISLFLISIFTSLFLANAYSDFKNKELAEDRQLKLDALSKTVNADMFAMKEVLTHHTGAINALLQGQATNNDNFLKFVQEYRTGQEANLKPIPSRKVAD